MAVREQPIQSYYPSCRVRLIIRFEDYGRSKNKPPDTPPQLRRGKKDKSSTEGNLKVEKVNGQLVLVAPGDNLSSLGTPQQQGASLDQYTYVLDGIIPSTASWSQNGVRTADTLNVELEFADLPLDPRAIRACGIQFFLGCVSADDFQKGVYGETRSSGSPSNLGMPLNVVPDTYVDSNGVSRSNLRFEGWVDSWEADWPEGEAPRISLECTDNTRILIEQDHPSRLAVSVDEPVDQAIANYLSNFPQFRGISVEYQPPGATAPSMKGALTKQAYPPGVGPTAAKNGDNKLSVWDYLTDVTKSIGLNIRFEGTRVILQRPRSLYNRRFPPRAEDPFQGREFPRIGSAPNRLMIYGQNVESMTFSREFTKSAPLNVEIRSYNPRRKKTLIARFPQIDKRSKRMNPGEGTDSKFEVLSIPGIQDEAVLRAVAQQLYEVLGRNELMVNIVTKNLGSYGGGNLDPDLLDMRIGDAVDCVVQRGDPEDDINTVTTIQGELNRRPEEFLLLMGYPASIAKAYANAVSDVSFPTTFRVKEIHTDWDKSSDGCRMDFDVVNYVEVRADADLPEGEEEAPTAGAGAPRQVVVSDEVQ